MLSRGSRVGCTDFSCVAMDCMCHDGVIQAMKVAPREGRDRGATMGSDELECVPLELVAQIGILLDDEVDQALGIVLADRATDRRTLRQSF